MRCTKSGTGSGLRPTRASAAIALFAAALVGGCDTDLDLTNPNAATEEEVLSTQEGILSLAVGMEGTYAASMVDFVVAPALVTDEWGTRAGALASYVALLTGEDLSDDFLVVEAPWATAYEVVRDADNLIEHAPRVGFDAGTEAGIVAVAKLFKAMALGTVALHFESAPIDVSVEHPAFRPRDEVVAASIALLESARQDVTGLTESDLVLVRNRVLGDGFDLHNTIDAMLARYALIAGDHATAIEAADRVDPSAFSVFAYPAPGENPIYNLSFELNYVAGLASFADDVEAGDARIAYWLAGPGERFGGNPPDTMLVSLNRYASQGAAYPVYLPDEMRLIRAEAYARSDRFAEARAEVNAVRTQCDPPVAEPAACLGELPEDALDTEAELLRQIAYERRYELYMQGLRWEDTRRFGTAATTTPTFEFLPTPRQECLANESVTCG